MNSAWQRCSGVGGESWVREREWVGLSVSYSSGGSHTWNVQQQVEADDWGGATAHLRSTRPDLAGDDTFSFIFTQRPCPFRAAPSPQVLGLWRPIVGPRDNFKQGRSLLILLLIINVIQPRTDSAPTSRYHACPLLKGGAALGIRARERRVIIRNSLNTVLVDRRSGHSGLGNGQV